MATNPPVSDLEPILIDLIARDAVAVPPYPGVAMRLRQVVGEGQYGVAELANVVSGDQVLVATVIRAANSAAFRGANQVSTLREALSRLGSEEVCRIALAATLGRAASLDGPLASLRRMAWRQGLTSAVVCRQLAAVRRLPAEEAFICGLLHDFGRVVAVACIESTLAKRPKNEIRPESEWMSLVDRFHVEIGVLTAHRWNLAELHRAVIGCHHDVQSAGSHRPMVELVALSDVVVGVMEQTPYVLPRDLAAIPGLNAQAREIDRLMEVLPLLPGFLTSIDDLLSAPTTQTDSRVARAGALPGHRKDVTLTAVWLRAGSEVPLKVTALAPEGLVVLSGKERLRENNLVRLKVRGPRGELEVSAKVRTSELVSGEHRSELSLFALVDKAKAAWDALYADPVSR